MNKKAFSMYPSIITVFILVLVIVVLAAKQNQVDLSTINKSIDTLNWSKFNAIISSSIQRVSLDKPNYVKTILEIAEKAIDFAGYSTFAIARLAMEIARDNPNIINFRVLLALLFISLISPVIYPAFIIIVSLILIVKEWWMVRKEKRSMGKLIKSDREGEESN